MGNACSQPAVIDSVECHAEALSEEKVGQQCEDRDTAATPSTAAAAGSPSGGEEETVEPTPKAVTGKLTRKSQDDFYNLYCEQAGSREANFDGKSTRRPSSENIMLDRYSERHAAEFDKVLELDRPEGWHPHGQIDGVEVYTRTFEGCSLAYFKGQATLHCKGGMGALLSKLFKTEDRPVWDEMCTFGASTHKAMPFYKYSLVQIKAPAPILSNRELLVVGRTRYMEDGSVIVSCKSVELPELPVVPGFVRAKFLDGGYVIRPAGEDDYLVTWTGCVDPCGFIPTFVANLTMKRQALTLAKLRSYLLEAEAKGK